MSLFLPIVRPFPATAAKRLRPSGKRVHAEGPAFGCIFDMTAGKYLLVYRDADGVNGWTQARTLHEIDALLAQCDKYKKQYYLYEYADLFPSIYEGDDEEEEEMLHYEMVAWPTFRRVNVSDVDEVVELAVMPTVRQGNDAVVKAHVRGDPPNEFFSGLVPTEKLAQMKAAVLGTKFSDPFDNYVERFLPIQLDGAVLVFDDATKVKRAL